MTEYKNADYVLQVEKDGKKRSLPMADGEKLQDGIDYYIEQGWKIVGAEILL